MHLRVYIFLCLIFHFSHALFSSLKDDDYEESEDVEDDSNLENDEKEDNESVKPKEDDSGDLGKIRISIDNDISINTDGSSFSGTKTPLIIISPTSIIDYSRLNKKMENSKKESNILVQEKLAMSDSNSRLYSLYNELKEAEARLAFYKADKSQLELLHNQSHEEEEL